MTANKKSAKELIFCYTKGMTVLQFTPFAFFTLVMTYFMNQFWLTGHYILGFVCAIFVVQNFRFARHVTKVIAAIEASTRKKD